MEPRSRRIQNLIAPVYAGVMLGVTLLCALFGKTARYGRMEYSAGALPWLIQLAVGLVFFLGLWTLCGKAKRSGRGLLPIRLTAAGLLALQLFAVYHYYFYTDWDLYAVMGLTDCLTHGKTPSAELAHYFSVYPNNLLLVRVFSLIQRAAHLLGLHEQEYFALLAVQCVLCAVTGVLVYRVLEKLFGDIRLAVFGFALYHLLIGASPWVSIPYSDAMGLIFPVLIFYLYLRREDFRREWIAWVWIGGLSFLGYRLKPQILILLIALALVKLLELPRAQDKGRFGRGAAGLVCGLVCAVLLSGWAVSDMGFTPEEGETYHLQHFLMMGLNPEEFGVFSQKDVDFSGSFHSDEERNAADLNRALERVRQMGLTGLGKLFARKTLTNYHDGTFCWAGEGKFFYTLRPAEQDPFAAFFRGLYYTRSCAETGIYFPVWHNFAQMLWATTLLLGIAAGLGRRRSETDILMLCLLGLTLFETLFEARARYLYHYAPFYLILAVSGARNLEARVKASRRI